MRNPTRKARNAVQVANLVFGENCVRSVSGWTPKDRQRLIADYLDGALQRDLATRYAIGLSSVKTILRDAGARKYAARR
jgi:hypothetical protein